MRKILPLILCAALLLSLFSGCAAEDTPYVPTGDALAAEDADVHATEAPEDTTPQELTLAYYTNRSLNPYVATDFTNRMLFSLIYQGLFSVNAKYEAVPMLCGSYNVSASYYTYTFYLDENAQFSDGTRVTNADVMASLEAAKTSSYYSGRFTYINTISETEDGGIAILLRVPIEDFQVLMDIPIVKASEVEAECPLGTGPYILKSGLSGKYLEKDYDWWCTSPDLLVTAETVNLYAAESTTDIRDEFEFGDVGLVLADPCSDSYADYRCDYELWDCDNSIFLYLGCNVSYSQDGIFADNTLRSVLTYAINREQLIEDNYNGFARAATLPMDPSCPYYSTSLASKYQYDPLKFIEGLRRVDLPKDPIRLLVNSDDSLRLRTARDIADMLEECGMQVEIIEKTTGAYVSAIKAGNYDLYLGQTRLQSNMDLSEFLRPWGSLHFGGLANEDLYTLCKDALENHGNYYNLHKAMAEDGRVVPILFCSYVVYATRGLVSDLKPARDNVFSYTLGKSCADILIANLEEGVG